MPRTIILMVVPFVVFSLYGNAFAQQQDIGVFYRNEAKCRVKQDGDYTPCKKGLVVAEGDSIETVRDVTTLGIQWIAPPHTHTEKIAANQYKAVFTRPAGKRSMVASIANILGFGRKSGHEGQYLVTRGVTRGAMQSPGRMASLLPGVPVTFTWCGDPGRKLIVTDGKSGTVIFSREISGLASFTVTPEAMGIKSGEPYTWLVEGSKESSGQLLLLRKELAAEINDGLEDIGKAALPESDKILQQAAYLSFLSDSYPDELSLYWRSQELLASLEQGNGDKDLIKMLTAAASDTMSCR